MHRVSFPIPFLTTTLIRINSEEHKYEYLMAYQYTIMHSPLDYTVHAKTMMQERMIQEDWVTSTVSAPEMVEEKRDDERHYLKRIPEHAGKFLRVIVNHSVHPPRVITVFFDRRVQP